MKVLLDCTFLRNRSTGVDIVFLGLVKYILKLDTENKYIILVDHRYDREILKNLLKPAINYKIVKIPCIYPFHIFVSAFVIPFYLKINKIDIYHNPYFFGPLFRLSKTQIIITVHDLYYKTIPEKVGYISRTFLNLFADRAIRKADEIIVISNQTKLDFKTYYPKVKANAHLVHQALDDSFEKKIEIKTDALAKYKLDDCKYILTVGSVLESKGIDTLITAFHQFLKENVNYHLKLVIAGNNQTPYYKKIENLIKELNLPQENILFLGYVNQNDLIALYNKAIIYILPSYYEGFGLTALEAMKFGRPVIARKASSLIEVVGNAGLLFTSSDELCKMITLVINNEELRERLISKGHSQLKLFTNEERAKQTLSIYLTKNSNTKP
jgi:glycosyltransferase involved in cell wall biosynthesis